MLLIIVALDEELSYIRETPAFKGRLDDPAENKNRPNGMFNIANRKQRIQFATIGTMGPEAAKERTQQLITEYSPELVISLGIAGAISTDTQIGDVVVADVTDKYMHRSKVIEAHEEDLKAPDFALGGKECRVDPILEPILHQQHKRLKGEHGDFTMFAGPIACGNLVVASDSFKTALKNRNRNFLCVDMESQGVAEAARNMNTPWLAIKGLSDLADYETKANNRGESETALEARKVAISNACRCLKTLSEKAIAALTHETLGSDAASSTGTELDYPQELAQELHRIALSEFLPLHYRDPHDVAEIAPALDSLLTAVSESKLTGNGSLKDILKNIANDSPSFTVIEGPSGTGKSTFLSMLYWSLHSETLLDDSNFLPIYFNTDRFGALGASLSKLDSNNEELLNSYLAKLDDLLGSNNKKPVILIVDGVDSMDSGERQALELLTKVADSRISGRVIAGARDPNVAALSRFSTPDTKRIKLTPMSVDRMRASTAALDALEALFSGRVNAREILKVAQAYRLDALDLFSIFLLAQHEKNRSGHYRDLSSTLEAYCRAHIQSSTRSLKEADDLMSEAKKLAFRRETQKVDRSYEPTTEMERKSWALTRTHPLVQQYLCATHVLDEFARIGEKGARLPAKKAMDIVYPYNINRFAKELLRGIDVQRRILHGVAKIFRSKSSSNTLKAHAAYLAGRLTDDQNRQEATLILENALQAILRKEKAEDFDPDKPQDGLLLLLRGIYISLAYLGHSAYAEQYVNQLLLRTDWDRFNRGFHLEYYGDQVYRPGQPLQGDDKLGPFPVTLQQLSQRLTALGENPLYLIEMHTLLSLAQHRHESGKLKESERGAVLEIVDAVAPKSIISAASDFPAYFGMVKKHLKERTKIPIGLLMEFLSLKTTKRIGWESRGMPDKESVADHIWATVVIGMFIEGAGDFGVESRRRLMLMLFTHDLAESRYGDFPKDYKGDKAAEERAFFDEIAVIGTYHSVPDMREVRDAWEEFEAKKTRLSKIAHDIDKLDNLITLLTYMNESAEISDSREWEAGLRNAIDTAEGLSLLKHYDDFV